MFRISKVENQWQFVFNCHLYLLFEYYYLNTFRNRIFVAVVQTTFTDSHDSKPRKLWRWTCDKWLKLLPPFFPHVFRKMRMTAKWWFQPVHLWQSFSATPTLLSTLTLNSIHLADKSWQYIQGTCHQEPLHPSSYSLPRSLHSWISF